MSLFIVLEGLDGSGISTQSKLLKDFLIKQGKEVVLTKEATDNVIGGLIKSTLKKEFKTSPLSLQLLFTADRAHHLDFEIEPALKKGKIVVSDRYFFSTLVFGGLDIDLEFLKMINSKFRVPDMTFIIDVLPKTCFNRIKKSRNGLELFEDLTKTEKIRENFLSIKNDFPNVYVIDGEKSAEKVAEEIQKIVISKL